MRATSSPLPAGEFMKPVLQTTAEDLRGPLDVGVFGAATAVQAVLEPMRAAGRGTILFTTGSAFITRNPERAGVGVSFSAEVAYAELLHMALAGEGIHVAHTTIHGGNGPGNAAGHRLRPGVQRPGGVHRRQRARLAGLAGQRGHDRIADDRTDRRRLGCRRAG
jgi:NAD(P)-dependent dehydrogenase (short-subunit alcohol dehydrogenase family)